MGVYHLRARSLVVRWQPPLAPLCKGREKIASLSIGLERSFVSTVLLGWELGEGLGHITKLLEVVRALAANGHSPVLAIRDIGVARVLLRDVPFPILQAPVWWEPVPLAFRASNYADILAIKGFADADGLALLVGAWQALIECTRAKVVIADFAPGLCLAAYGVLPTVVNGSGFTVPPAHGDEFPRIGPRFGTIKPPDQILEIVREVQRRRGRPAPATLPALLAGSARFVHTIDEIDAYKGIRAGEIVEPMSPPGPPLPPPEPHTFFAYLNCDYLRSDRLLPELAAAGFSGSAYSRRATPRIVDAVAVPG